MAPTARVSGKCWTLTSLLPWALLTTQKTGMSPKDKRPAPRKDNECIACDYCLMLSVNLEMHCFFSGGLCDYPSCGFTINPF